MDAPTLKWAAQWIEDSLKGETNERVIEFGRNMAMTFRAATQDNGSGVSPAVSVDTVAGSLPHQPDSESSPSPFATERSETLRAAQGDGLQLLEAIASAYPDEPRLDDEQPVLLCITLGDVRLAKRLLRESH